MPDPVSATADSSSIVKEQAGNSSERIPAVLQASDITTPTDTNSVSKTRPDATPHAGQPETGEATSVLSELSPRQRLLRPEHRKALPEFDEIEERFEETSLNRITKSRTLLYVEAHTLFQLARSLDMDAEILARQAAGHCLTNHNRYHELNGGDPPCKGFGNWLLRYVASVLAPGFSTRVPNAAPGGSFIEGVICIHGRLDCQVDWGGDWRPKDGHPTNCSCGLQPRSTGVGSRAMPERWSPSQASTELSKFKSNHKTPTNSLASTSEPSELGAGPAMLPAASQQKPFATRGSLTEEALFGDVPSL